MEQPFFGRFGNNIVVEDRSDFTQKLDEIDFSVPKRSEGRKSSHRERWCLKHYLEILDRNNILTFPLKIEKSESPDFLISDDTGKRGLEITEGTTPQYQLSLTHQDKNPEDTSVESLQIFNQTDPPPSSEEIEKSLRRRNDKLIGRGWYGDSVEREWVKIMVNTIVQKTKKMNDEHFHHQQIMELLIYDNNHLGIMLELETGLSYLKESLHKPDPLRKFRTRFDILSILSDQSLVYDVLSKGRIFK